MPVPRATSDECSPTRDWSRPWGWARSSSTARTRRGQDVAHDLPLLATLAFVGADAAADLTGRPRGWWWSLPTAALLTLVVVAPRAGDLAQVGVAAVAAVLTVLRGAARPGLRRHIGPAIALLALGGTIGTPSRAGWPWCDPMSLLQGHAVWHMLASAALVVLAPTVGTRGTRAHRA